MKIVFDLEANRLVNPDKIWVFNATDVGTGEEYVWYSKDGQVHKDPEFIRFLSGVTHVIGHNCIGYDLRVLGSLTGFNIDPQSVTDTLVVSRIVDFDRPGGHSLEAWGVSFGIPKVEVKEDQWETWSNLFLDRCQRDKSINLTLYNYLLPYLNSEKWKEALWIETTTAYFCNLLTENGFGFDLPAALKIREDLTSRLAPLEAELQAAFPPKTVLVREVHPRRTKYGTLNKTDFRWYKGDDYTQFNGGPFSLFEWQAFNPGSAKQRIERLNEAGWRPTQKTKGHLHYLRSRERTPDKDRYYETYGWVCSEENLDTLPEDAPEGARKLARWLILSRRVLKLDEWIPLARPSIEHGGHRIHGSYLPIGAWTHRKAHRDPNLANIPTEKPKDTPEIRELNHAFRRLWVAAPGRVLVGVDADQIQLRILAHYMGDARFIEALVSGRKEDATDVHNLNAKALGSACKGRRDAKTFIYAWLLGAGIARIANILQCSTAQARQANDDFIDYYPGLKEVKNVLIPADAERGYFRGIDGRFIRIRGDDRSQREHYCLGGYLQSGESIIMKYASTQIWLPRLIKEKIPFWPVNDVHDEWQTETYPEYAEYIQDVQADSIRLAGEHFGLRCPMKGSVMSGRDETVRAIGTNWLDTH